MDNDLVYQQAAKAIQTSDIILVHTGAGMSADSGLSVYKDVANIEAYKRLKIEYADLSCMSCLETTPELFYGFWGDCFNTYPKTTPHEGYQILKKWKQNLSLNSKCCEFFQRGIQNLENSNAFPKGPFVLRTSNVDCHSIQSGLVDFHELFEIHGNIRTWQCSIPCKEESWLAPNNFEFKIETDTRKAYDFKLPDEVLTEEFKNSGFTSNHPRCKFCGALARPSIVMFGDITCVFPRRFQYYLCWEELCEKWLQENQNAKMVVLEIGCGLNVPTLRGIGERILQEIPNSYLIRINQDFPDCQKANLKERVFAIQEKGLIALKKIDHILQNR